MPGNRNKQQAKINDAYRIINEILHTQSDTKIDKEQQITSILTAFVRATGNPAENLRKFLIGACVKYNLNGDDALYLTKIIFNNIDAILSKSDKQKRWMIGLRVCTALIVTAVTRELKPLTDDEIFVILKYCIFSSQAEYRDSDHKQIQNILEQALTGELVKTLKPTKKALYTYGNNVIETQDHYTEQTTKIKEFSKIAKNNIIATEPSQKILLSYMNNQAPELIIEFLCSKSYKQLDIINEHKINQIIASLIDSIIHSDLYSNLSDINALEILFSLLYKMLLEKGNESYVFRITDIIASHAKEIIPEIDFSDAYMLPYRICTSTVNDDTLSTISKIDTSAEDAINIGAQLIISTIEQTDDKYMWRFFISNIFYHFISKLESFTEKREIILAITDDIVRSSYRSKQVFSSAQIDAITGVLTINLGASHVAYSLNCEIDQKQWTDAEGHPSPAAPSERLRLECTLKLLSYELLNNNDNVKHIYYTILGNSTMTLDGDTTAEERWNSRNLFKIAAELRRISETYNGFSANLEGIYFDFFTQVLILADRELDITAIKIFRISNPSIYLDAHERSEAIPGEDVCIICLQLAKAYANIKSITTEAALDRLHDDASKQIQKSIYALLDSDYRCARLIIRDYGSIIAIPYLATKIRKYLLERISRELEKLLKNTDSKRPNKKVKNRCIHLVKMYESYISMLGYPLIKLPTECNCRAPGFIEIIAQIKAHEILESQPTEDAVPLIILSRLPALQLIIDNSLPELSIFTHHDPSDAKLYNSLNDIFTTNSNNIIDLTPSIICKLSALMLSYLNHKCFNEDAGIYTDESQRISQLILIISHWITSIYNHGRNTEYINAVIKSLRRCEELISSEDSLYEKLLGKLDVQICTFIQTNCLIEISVSQGLQETKDSILRYHKLANKNLKTYFYYAFKKETPDSAIELLEAYLSALTYEESIDKEIGEDIFSTVTLIITQYKDVNNEDKLYQLSDILKNYICVPTTNSHNIIVARCIYKLIHDEIKIQASGIMSREKTPPEAECFRELSKTYTKNPLTLAIIINVFYHEYCYEPNKKNPNTVELKNYLTTTFMATRDRIQFSELLHYLTNIILIHPPERQAIFVLICRLIINTYVQTVIRYNALPFIFEIICSYESHSTFLPLLQQVLYTDDDNCVDCLKSNSNISSDQRKKHMELMCKFVELKGLLASDNNDKAAIKIIISIFTLYSELTCRLSDYMMPDDFCWFIVTAIDNNPVSAAKCLRISSTITASQIKKATIQAATDSLDVAACAELVNLNVDDTLLSKTIISSVTKLINSANKNPNDLQWHQQTAAPIRELVIRLAKQDNHPLIHKVLQLYDNKYSQHEYSGFNDKQLLPSLRMLAEVDYTADSDDSQLISLEVYKAAENYLPIKILLLPHNKIDPLDLLRQIDINLDLGNQHLSAPTFDNQTTLRNYLITIFNACYEQKSKILKKYVGFSQKNSFSTPDDYILALIIILANALQNMLNTIDASSNQGKKYQISIVDIFCAYVIASHSNHHAAEANEILGFFSHAHKYKFIPPKTEMLLLATLFADYNNIRRILAPYEDQFDDNKITVLEQECRIAILASRIKAKPNPEDTDNLLLELKALLAIIWQFYAGNTNQKTSFLSLQADIIKSSLPLDKAGKKLCSMIDSMVAKLVIKKGELEDVPINKNATTTNICTAGGEKEILIAFFKSQHISNLTDLENSSPAQLIISCRTMHKITASDNYGFNIFHYLAMIDATDIAEELATKRLSPTQLNELINAEGAYPLTPVQIAAFQGNFNMLCWLAMHDANFDRDSLIIFNYLLDEIPAFTKHWDEWHYWIKEEYGTYGSIRLGAPKSATKLTATYYKTIGKTNSSHRLTLNEIFPPQAECNEASISPILNSYKNGTINLDETIEKLSNPLENNRILVIRLVLEIIGKQDNNQQLLAAILQTPDAENWELFGSKCNDDNDTLMHLAAKRGNYHAVSILLLANKRVDNELKTHDEQATDCDEKTNDEITFLSDQLYFRNNDGDTVAHILARAATENTTARLTLEKLKISDDSFNIKNNSGVSVNDILAQHKANNPSALTKNSIFANPQMGKAFTIELPDHGKITTIELMREPNWKSIPSDCGFNAIEISRDDFINALLRPEIPEEAESLLIYEATQYTLAFKFEGKKKYNIKSMPNSSTGINGSKSFQDLFLEQFYNNQYPNDGEISQWCKDPIVWQTYLKTYYKTSGWMVTTDLHAYAAATDTRICLIEDEDGSYRCTAIFGPEDKEIDHYLLHTKAEGSSGNENNHFVPLQPTARLLINPRRLSISS